MRPRAGDSDGSLLWVAESKQKAQECGIGDVEFGNVEHDAPITVQFCGELRKKGRREDVGTSRNPCFAVLCRPSRLLPAKLSVSRVDCGF